MSNVQFFESPYKFTDPIRLYKENDPYHASVDNIPIAQLEENTKFLKEQVEGLLGKTSTVSINRSEFSELQPYATGQDNLVRVKPGRYTARVNDAYNIDPLQFIIALDTEYSNWYKMNSWTAQTVLGSSVSAVLNTLQSNLAADALNMNGLAERAFTYPMRDWDSANNLFSQAGPSYSVSFDNNKVPAYPGFLGKLWAHGVNSTTRVIEPGDLNDPFKAFITINIAESEFIKRWRGVVRTAIVDVAEELSIEIPEYSDEDFFYTDEFGIKREIANSNYRIDLVFIYSKAVDQKETTINKFVDGNPVSINKPILGLVKGAGLGLKRRGFVTGPNANPLDDISLIDDNGNPQIIPSVADQYGSAGFSGVAGSFPSPDDLMNLAPLLCESLEGTAYPLIGQTILPVAYVVSRKGVSPLISTTDVIDIRPIFRTTELTYNERAGIAAATPQISIANPVASEIYVDRKINEVWKDSNTKFASLVQQTSIQQPRVVGSGYVKGGFRFGVEGTLGKFVALSEGISFTNLNLQKQRVISRFGYPENTTLVDYPDWDLSEWAKNKPNPGFYPNDYINVHAYGVAPPPGGNTPPVLNLGHMRYAETERLDTVDRLATDPLDLNGRDRGHSCIYFVKKKIFINRSSAPWMKDYFVNVQYLNCIPMSSRGFREVETGVVLPGHAGIWVDKSYNYFTIFVAWVASDWVDYQIGNSPVWGGPIANTTQVANSLPYNSAGRNDALLYAGFSVITEDIMKTQYPSRDNVGESNAGVALYPTVTFQVVGIPEGFGSNLVNANTINPVISIS